MKLVDLSPNVSIRPDRISCMTGSGTSDDSPVTFIDTLDGRVLRIERHIDEVRREIQAAVTSPAVDDLEQAGIVGVLNNVKAIAQAMGFKPEA